MTENKPEEITSADLEIEGSSEKAPRQCEDDCTVEPEELSEDTVLEESDDVEESTNCHILVDRDDPWTATLGRCANLKEREQIVTEGSSLKKRRRAEADSGHYATIDPRRVKYHDRFRGLLSIDEDLVDSMSVDMAVEGYKLSKPIVLGTWPGQEELVLIDGHTRVQSAIRSGIKKIPYTIERFDDIDGALRFVASIQTKRRQNNDWVVYKLICELDNTMDRGGDRRSEKAKSKGPDGPIETQYKNSAQRTADIVGTNETTVKRARRIQREGTDKIIQAIRDGKLKISQAVNAIINAKKTVVESKAIQDKDNLVALTDDNLAGLKELGGNRHAVVNTAVAEFIARQREIKSTEGPIKPEEKVEEPAIDLSQKTDKES